MAPEQITGKAVAFVIGVFLVLALLHLWWQGRESQVGAREGAMTVMPTRVGGEGGEVEIGGESATPVAERDRIRREELKRLLHQLTSGSVEEKRSAALHLQYLADSSAEPILLKMLKSEDTLVAQRCAKALLSLWQQSDSAAVNRLLSQGLAAYEAGRMDEALDRFDMSAVLDADVPDLYRLRAEILLERGEVAKAISDCRHALELKPGDFMAHYVEALCYKDLNDLNSAMKSVDRSLEVYPGFQKAYQLKVEIFSLLKAEEQ